jgi:hypothetical protein
LSTLRYRTSKTSVASNPAMHAWNSDLFGPVQDNLGGPVIESVTYPRFYTDGVNFLLYLRLGGGSGSANSHHRSVWQMALGGRTADHPTRIQARVQSKRS